jgi:methyl-accepting chemotaxis protein
MTGIIVFVTSMYTISINEKKSFKIINLTNDITQNIYEIMSIEDKYLSTNDKKYIKNYEKLKKKLDRSFLSLSYISGTKTSDLILKLTKLEEEHTLLFGKIITYKNSIEIFKNLLKNEIEQIKSIINAYVKTINDDEATLYLDGKLLPRIKESFRNQNINFLLKWYERYSYYQTITINSDIRTIVSKREQTIKDLSLIIHNIETLSKPYFGIHNYDNKWKDVKNAQKKALKYEDALMTEHIVGQIITKKLSVNREKEKQIAAQIYTIESNNIKDQQKRTHFIIVILISVALITISLMSFILFKSIMVPIFKTIETIKTTSKGNLETKLDIKQKGELKELAGAVNRMIDNLRLKADFANKVSLGNLKEDLQITCKEDSLGIALLKMSESLNHIIRNISNTSENVFHNSGTITNISKSLLKGSETQLESLQTISNLIKNIKDAAGNNYENAKDVSELALNTKNLSQKGYDEIKEMHKSIVEINRSSRDIVKINKVIDDIAFQTQLLSLNASIEAARAGKHGKGFSVVATEIRNLAEKSSDAANETTNIIKGTIETIGKGRVTTESAQSSFKTIVQGVNSVSELIDGIVKASYEQQGGINEINDGIKLIEKVTVNNVTNSEKTDLAANDLMKQVDDLSNLLSNFKL